ncbi:MAG: OmpA family protein [Bacteroidota bacterium]
MKAVLIFLAAMVLLGIFAMPTLAELELSVDYFWGDGESNEPTEPEDQEQAAFESESYDSSLNTNSRHRHWPHKPKHKPTCTPIPTPTPEPTSDPGPTDDPGPTSEPTPIPSPIPPLKQRSDLKGIILGLRYPIGRFRPAFELGTGDEKGDGWKEDFELLEMKAGYALVEGTKGRLEPYLSYLNLEAGGYDISGPMLGLDFRYQLAPRISLDGGAGFSFDPNLKKDGIHYHDESVSMARLKFIYHLNERWDLGLGYRVYRFDGNTAGGSSPGVDGKYALTTLGFTLKLGVKPKPEPAPKEPQPEPEPPAPQPEPKPESKPEPQPEPMPESEPELQEEPHPEEPAPEEYRLLKPIFFDFDKSNLRDDQRPSLDWNLAIIKDHPDLYILIAGHADYRGSVDYNVALSKRRAQTVADYLVTNGIAPQRITIYAYGETYPYDKYDTNPDWESDRWVDILVSDLPPSWELGIEKRGVPAELK